MPIKRITPKYKAKEYLDSRLERFRKSIINSLSHVGEVALTQARNNHKYTDRTGNLTSSIGYCILDNGKVVLESEFEVVLGGHEGAKIGKQFLEEIKKEHKEGIVFIMVAGMNYAVYVEAMGLDVLDSAEIMAKQMVPEILKEIRL